MKILNILLVCAGMIMPAVSVAQDGNKAAAQSIEAALKSASSSVKIVAEAGEWKSQNGKNGTRRIVLLAQGKNTQSLYVQWVSAGNAKQGVTPYTLEIPEIRSLKQAITDISSHVEVDGQVTVYLETETNGDPNLPYGYELYLSSREEYSFTPAASN